MARWHKISRTVDDKEIAGTYLSAFIHNGDRYFLTQIGIYQDGMIDCWGLVNYEEFEAKVASGWVVTSLPKRAKVSIHSLAYFTVADVQYHIDEEEFIKEVRDELDRLNGRPTSSQKCKEAFKQFQENPTDQARNELREAYESIPKHNRRYVLGDMDVKDIPIRMIIYGEDEIEKWSHRILARRLGDPLPTIKIRGALKKPQETENSSPNRVQRLLAYLQRFLGRRG